MVWSLAIDPADPRVMFAGTGTPSKAGIYRTPDGGQHLGAPARWRLPPSARTSAVPRPTGIAIDPTDHRHVWVGLEVDGVRHSADGGETWTQDQRADPQPGRAQRPRGREAHPRPSSPWSTTTCGAAPMTAPPGSRRAPARSFPGTTRGVSPSGRTIGRTVFLTLGDSTPGRVGTVMRSRDAGATWQSLGLPVQPNSAMWTVSMPASAPETVLAASQLWLSLSQRRRRRLLAQALAGVRRGVVDNVPYSDADTEDPS